MKELTENEKPYAFKKENTKETTTHHPREHAWPKRKSALPVFLFIAFLLIVAYGYMTNSFEMQYARLAQATLQYSEDGGTIPIGLEKRIEFRKAIEEIQPAPFLNNGDIVTGFVGARIAFMDAQDGLNKRLDSGSCTSDVREALTMAHQRSIDAQMLEEKAIGRLGNEPPTREKSFLSIITALQLIIEEEIQNCANN